MRRTTDIYVLVANDTVICFFCIAFGDIITLPYDCLALELRLTFSPVMPEFSTLS